MSHAALAAPCGPRASTGCGTAGVDDPDQEVRWIVERATGRLGGRAGRRRWTSRPPSGRCGAFDAMVARRATRRAAAVRARALGVPHARPAGRPPRADPAAGDRGGRRSGDRRARSGSDRPARRRRPRHRLGRHRPVAGGRALAARRGVGDRRVGGRARGRRANLAGLGRPRAPSCGSCEGSWFEPLPAELRGTHRRDRVQPALRRRRRMPLPAEVADWEPTGALVPGPTGLEDIEVIVAGAPSWLTPSTACSSSRSARRKAMRRWPGDGGRLRRRRPSTSIWRPAAGPRRPEERLGLDEDLGVGLGVGEILEGLRARRRCRPHPVIIGVTSRSPVGDGGAGGCRTPSGRTRGRTGG